MAQQLKRGSAPGKGDHSGKRPRAPVVQDGVVSNEVVAEAEFILLCKAERAVVSMEAVEEPQISLKFSLSTFMCKACHLPLKPPIFKRFVYAVKLCTMFLDAVRDGPRRVRHLLGQPRPSVQPRRHLLPLPRAGLGRHGRQAAVPERGVRVPESGLLLLGRRPPRRVPVRACYCPEPDCGFVSSSAQLVEHFRGVHAWLVYPFSYPRPGKLAVPAPASRHILVGEGDDAVFLVFARSLGAATAVSLVRVTGTAAAAGQFWCKLMVEHPSSENGVTMFTTAVRNSDLKDGLPGLDDDMLLVVPPVLLHDTSSSDVPKLVIVIDKHRSATTPPLLMAPMRLQRLGDLLGT
ncbi:hypothetical protein EJB05_51204, partial [Eragrostis curvula]